MLLPAEGDAAPDEGHRVSGPEGQIPVPMWKDHCRVIWKIREFRSHHNAGGVAANVLSPGVAAAIPIKEIRLSLSVFRIDMLFDNSRWAFEVILLYKDDQLHGSRWLASKQKFFLLATSATS